MYFRRQSHHRTTYDGKSYVTTRTTSIARRFLALYLTGKIRTPCTCNVPRGPEKRFSDATWHDTQRRCDVQRKCLVPNLAPISSVCAQLRTNPAAFNVLFPRGACIRSRWERLVLTLQSTGYVYSQMLLLAQYISPQPSVPSRTPLLAVVCLPAAVWV